MLFEMTWTLSSWAIMPDERCKRRGALIPCLSCRRDGRGGARTRPRSLRPKKDRSRAPAPRPQALIWAPAAARAAALALEAAVRLGRPGPEAAPAGDEEGGSAAVARAPAPGGAEEGAGAS